MKLVQREKAKIEPVLKAALRPRSCSETEVSEQL
jgi:hypothetical protein